MHHLDGAFFDADDEGEKEGALEGAEQRQIEDRRPEMEIGNGFLHEMLRIRAWRKKFGSFFLFCFLFVGFFLSRSLLLMDVCWWYFFDVVCY